jgi:hypothetical protein
MAFDMISTSFEQVKQFSQNDNRSVVVGNHYLLPEYENMKYMKYKTSPSLMNRVNFPGHNNPIIILKYARARGTGRVTKSDTSIVLLTALNFKKL